MGILDFAAGWVLGAKTGSQGFDDVVATGKEIFESKEFQDFLGALRAHASYSLRELSELIAVDDGKPPSEDLVDFVRALAAKRDSWTSGAPWR